MMMKIFVTEEQERRIAELTEWLFGDVVSPDDAERMAVCMGAMRLGLEQMTWEMEQGREQEESA